MNVGREQRTSMEKSHRLKVTFYGDDFTGATDTLATAARAGLRTLLFLGVPTDEQLRQVGILDCLGIAGAARAMSPGEMQQELEPIGRLFAALDAPLVHYKVCSTFDSALDVGSIGAAVNILRCHVENTFIPIVGGQPNLRRYCLFGNLFAGVGSTEDIYRIDRHPTMSRHPVTPMTEADLTRHLARQGLQNVVSLDYTNYAKAEVILDQSLERLLARQPDAVLMDVAQVHDLATIGRLIWREACRARLLAIGASSVIQALAAHWQGENNIDTALPPVMAATGPVFVLAGSLSPVTATQLHHAYSYQKVWIDAQRLITQPTYVLALVNEVVTLLQAGQSVLACTVSPDKDSFAQAEGDSRSLAVTCGTLLAKILQQQPLKRIGIAGGDTSSHGVQALNAWGLSYLTQLDDGVALCRLHSENSTLDGMEVMLKGGQMGKADLFERLLRGTKGEGGRQKMERTEQKEMIPKE